MNTATRVINSAEIRAFKKNGLQVSVAGLGITALVLAILLSAFGVIYLKDLSRRLFIQSQDVQQVQQQYQIDWGKLLLEQSTWSSQSRIQQLAQQRMDMVVPSIQNVKMAELTQ